MRVGLVVLVVEPQVVDARGRARELRRRQLLERLREGAVVDSRRRLPTTMAMRY
jgi:hypothetical protein